MLTLQFHFFFGLLFEFWCEIFLVSTYYFLNCLQFNQNLKKICVDFLYAYIYIFLKFQKIVRDH
jgi:hypothetical protein